MGEIQDYPDGTPSPGDKVPYVADPTGTPALLLADVSALGGGGDSSLYPSSGDPNDDVTVPSPPPDVRALAYDADSVELDLYRWDATSGTYLDPFTGTDGTNLIGATAPNGATYGGIGTWTIEGNTATQTGGTGGRRLYADWGSADVTVSIPLTTAHNEDGLVLRHNAAAGRWLVLKVSGADIYLQKYDADAYVGAVGSWPISVTDGMVLAITLAGDTYEVTFDGTSLGTGSGGYLTDTVSDTFHGLEAYGTTSFDNLSVVVGDGSGAWVPEGSGLGSGGGGSGAADGSSTLEEVAAGTAETVIATVSQTGPGVQVVMMISLSNNDPGENKDTTVRVRRTDLSGTILYAVSTGGSADSVDGLMFAYEAFLYDDAPTGTWVLTVQAGPATSPATEIWVARRSLTAIA